jgi:tetratricopeptide (TPR) repeat protein
MAGSCATPHPRQGLQFDPLVIIGDVELEKLNDEELFAHGTSAFAAKDFRQASRFFDRLADSYPSSPHRREAIYKSGLAYEREKKWEQASSRFVELADPERGTGEALEAAFRLAEAFYYLERYSDAARVLGTIAVRSDLPASTLIEAKVQRGVCEVELGTGEIAERTLREALELYQAQSDKRDIDEAYPAQGEFFLGEIYRIRSEAVSLRPDHNAEELAQDLEYRAELLLSAQGHYLRAIRIGDRYWSTASGAQIGMLYENLYSHLINSPAPAQLNPEEVEVYRQEVRKRVRVLVSKAINIYERTLEAAERIGSASNFIDRTRESLRKLKELLIAEGEREDDDKKAVGR